MNKNINYNFIKNYINNLNPKNEYQKYALKKLKKTNTINSILKLLNITHPTKIIKHNFEENFLNSANKIIITDGLYNYKLSNNLINVTNIEQQFSELIKSFYTINYINKLNSLDLLNYVDIKNIIYIHISKNTLLNEPIFIIQKNTSIINNTKIFINIEKNTKLKLIEMYTNDNIKSFNYCSYHIKINNNSNIKHLILNNSNNNINFLKYNININNNIKYTQKYISLNTLKINYNLKIKILGSNSNIKIKNLDMPNKYQKHNMNYIIEHKKPYNKSNCITKNLLKYESLSKFYGIIKIDEKAVKSKSNLHIKGLILSKYGIIKYMPQLLIKNKNILCNHSATIGTFDNSLILYMKARGINQNEILQLLINSFIYSVIKNIPYNITNLINKANHE
ncbi:MAG: SufD family Fe-S cluster assembly protein [Candidatus Azosocius agrarius]|nr:MAG: SufD family Fe-S cluster assembly protein [Gammaproteobacteria bacterium]